MHVPKVPKEPDFSYLKNFPQNFNKAIEKFLPVLNDECKLKSRSEDVTRIINETKNIESEAKQPNMLSRIFNKIEFSTKINTIVTKLKNIEFKFNLSKRKPIPKTFSASKTDENSSLASERLERKIKGDSLANTCIEIIEKNEADLPSNITRINTIRWNSGNKQANYLFHLAFVYETGEGKLKKDEFKAFKLFKLAANHGSVDAMYKLSQYYKNDKNDEMALKWLNDCVKSENRPLFSTTIQDAKCELGLYYKEQGRTEEAIKLLQEAASNGSEKAIEALKPL